MDGVVIALNVGGQRYDVSRATLTCISDSMLNRMFCGDLPVQRDEQGCAFIDRSGRHFEHVLDYLRDQAAWASPSDSDVLVALRNEARYFILPGMEGQIEAALRDTRQHFCVLCQKYFRQSENHGGACARHTGSLTEQTTGSEVARSPCPNAATGIDFEPCPLCNMEDRPHGMVESKTLRAVMVWSCCGKGWDSLGCRNCAHGVYSV
eukprot:CAMPEP_0204583862 /NCGR_PEP_ID=MMETSP0661-20131031/46016_1 /ASSEMBLY_ACC=CAM_ASM_000606 /TAXON_ID=109239 /ORGANISM="Alexandrium margalefi, Strain AMGDE01CS-322" /LENGTH=206 /DNA_ID=CAMNT_0051593257 /DNA_START=47 /DNA_END=667 /DNA_ORIENTATION=+